MVSLHLRVYNINVCLFIFQNVLIFTRTSSLITVPRYNRHDEHHYLRTGLLPAIWNDHFDGKHDHHRSSNNA